MHAGKSMFNCEKYFDNYVSNTLAGSSNQTFFESDGKVKKSRAYYKLTEGGNFKYSLLYSNIIDSTFRDGSISVCNMRPDCWKIIGLKAGTVKECGMENAAEPESFARIYFGGSAEKYVEKGEVFYSDPIEISAEAGEYLCVETEFSGRQIPCHNEFWAAAFVYENGKWVSNADIPVPSMVGCDRRVDTKIAYLGDSITQGIGSEKNSYLHWCAVLSDLLGGKNAYWNLGIGCARSGDAASDGVWLYKALQCDVVFVCLGVNDILKGKTAREVIENLEKIVGILKRNGKKVIIQSVPPFDYEDERIETWTTINDYIRNVLSIKTDGYFDCVEVLGKSKDAPYAAKFGGHPNNEGCGVWARSLYPYVKEILV